MYNKQHLISILWYIWIWFIGGSISHGFFSWTRSIVMAILGIIMFIISEYLKWWAKDYAKLIIGWLVFSVAIGMVSGGFQHFLDSPMRSLWIIPVWWIISTIIFPYKEGLTSYNFTKSIVIGVIISIWLTWILYILIHTMPDSYFWVGWHHGWITSQNIMSSWSTINTTTAEVTITQPQDENTPNHH
jgi:hypothetical protein